jgi:hypothetical protein
MYFLKKKYKMNLKTIWYMICPISFNFRLKRTVKNIIKYHLIESSISTIEALGINK